MSRGLTSDFDLSSRLSVHLSGQRRMVRAAMLASGCLADCFNCGVALNQRA